MSDETADEQHSALDTLVAFCRAVYHPATRRVAITETVVLVGKFALPCVVVVAAVAAPQIHGLGLAVAWKTFGVQWILWPVAIGLVPIVFALGCAAIEGAILSLCIVGILLFSDIPSLIVGEERAGRWLKRAKYLPLFAFGGFVVLCAWSGGAESVAPGHGHQATPATSSVDWAGIWHWFATNPWMVVIGGLLVKGVTELAKKWTATIADEIVRPAPKRRGKLYAPDNTIVCEFDLDNQ